MEDHQTKGLQNGVTQHRKLCLSIMLGENLTYSDNIVVGLFLFGNSTIYK